MHLTSLPRHLISSKTIDVIHVPKPSTGPSRPVCLWPPHTRSPSSCLSWCSKCSLRRARANVRRCTLRLSLRHGPLDSNGSKGSLCCGLCSSRRAMNQKPSESKALRPVEQLFSSLRKCAAESEELSDESNMTEQGATLSQFKPICPNVVSERGNQNDPFEKVSSVPNSNMLD